MPAQHNKCDMPDKRNFYVANATNAVILVRASDDDTILLKDNTKHLHIGGGASANVYLTEGVGGTVGGVIGFEHVAQTFQKTLCTKTGFAPLESQKAIHFDKGAYLTYATEDYGKVNGPIATPTTCRAFIVTETSLLKSKVLSSKPTLEQAFTEELSRTCYLKTSKKKGLEKMALGLQEDGVGSHSATVDHDEDGEGSPCDFEEYTSYDD